MSYAGIDVSKDKHDCLITDSDGVVLWNPSPYLTTVPDLIPFLVISDYALKISQL